MSAPQWLKKALFYEIYPQSFYDTNGDGIGDLNGIIEKLDYIKELGCNAIWINPMFVSPFFDAGYDVTDYYQVAPRYGTNEDAKRLFEVAHEKGIRILLDLVPGHTAIDCAWFTESCKAKKNLYTDRYIWTDCVWKQHDDLNSLTGFYERNGACATNFFTIQPALNYGFYEIKHPEYEQKITDKGPQDTIAEMIDVMRFWLDMGCDGFRVDMAGSLVKRDPEKKGTQEVWRQIFSVIKKEYPESAFVSEWNDGTKSLDAGFDMDFYLQDYGWTVLSHMTRGEGAYFQRDGREKDSAFFMDFMAIRHEYAKKNQAYMCMISGNHDTERIRRTLNEEEMKYYYNFMYLLPGCPFLYYGDEIAMKFEENLDSVEGGYQRTGSRSPMQWDTSYQAGFTTSDTPYIPINPDRKGISVEEQEKDANSVLNYLKEVIRFRKQYDAFDADGEFHILRYGRHEPVVFRRKKSDSFLVTFNMTEREQLIDCPSDRAEIVRGEGEIKDYTLILKPHTFAVVKE